MKAFNAGADLSFVTVALALALASGGPGWAQTAAESEADRSMREAMADSILGERESRTGRALEPAYRHSLMRRLSSRPAEDLRALVTDPDAPIPGGASSDLSYTPIAPCRIIDTRAAGAGGAIPGGTIRAFFVAGNLFFDTQGGNVSGCGIPLGPATAAMLEIATIGASAPGFLRAFAWDSPTPPTPTAAVLNYGVLSGLPAIANGIAVPICEDGIDCSFDLFIQASSTTHVIVDVLGYFARPDANVVADLVTKNAQAVNASSFTEVLRSDIVLPDKCVGTADGWAVLVMASGHATLASVALNARFALSRNNATTAETGTLTVANLVSASSFSAWHSQWVFTGLNAGTHIFRTLAATGASGQSFFAANNRMVVQVLGNSCP